MSTVDKAFLALVIALAGASAFAVGMGISETIALWILGSR